jgi:hypothetical protein
MLTVLEANFKIKDSPFASTCKYILAFRDRAQVGDMKGALDHDKGANFIHTLCVEAQHLSLPPPNTHTHTQTHQNKYFGTATLFLQASAGINIVLSARVHSGQTKTSGFWCAPTNEERKECKAFYVCFLLT